jgi:hypothetical protein
MEFRRVISLGTLDAPTARSASLARTEHEPVGGKLEENQYDLQIREHHCACADCCTGIDGQIVGD